MRPSPLCPTTKGVGSAQAKEVRDCTYLEAHPSRCSKWPSPRSEVCVWDLNSLDFPACRAPLWESARVASLSPPLGLKSRGPGLVTAACRARHTALKLPRFPPQGLDQAASATPLQPSLPAEPLLTDLLGVVEIVFQLLLMHQDPDCFSKSVLLLFTIPPLPILCHPPHTHKHTFTHLAGDCSLKVFTQGSSNLLNRGLRPLEDRNIV